MDNKLNKKYRSFRLLLISLILSSLCPSYCYQIFYNPSKNDIYHSLDSFSTSINNISNKTDIIGEEIDQLINSKKLEFNVFTDGDLNITELLSPTGEIYNRLSLEGGIFFGDAGSPRLPIKNLKVLIPSGYKIENIEVNVGKTKIIILDHAIEPTQEQVPIGFNITQEYVFDSVIYNSSDPFPGIYYSFEGINFFRGYKILLLNLYPVQYFPNSRKISVSEDMIISIDLMRVLDYNKNLFLRNLRKDEEKVMSIVINPEGIKSYREMVDFESSLSPILWDYVIITNEMLKNSASTYTFQYLANLKNLKGIKTIIVNVEEIYANYTGVDNQEKIRNFIIDAYSKWGIEYVLLGGDGDGADVGGESGDFIIPARNLYCPSPYGDDFIPSDLYYSALDGTWNDDNYALWGEPGEDDLFAEVYVGRAPVDSEEELSNFIMKTIAHEASIDEDYLSRALMIGEDLGWHPVYGSDYKNEILYGSSNNGYTTIGFPDEFNVSTLYEPPHWSKANLLALLNDRMHVINHLGHSNNFNLMKLNNDDIDSLLTNENYFFVYSQGCYAGAFDNRGSDDDDRQYFDFDCIVEHFITSPYGAFAFIANSRYGWGDRYGTNGASQFFDREFFDAIFGEGILEIGRANQDSKEDCIGFLSQKYVRWCYYQITLFGDPTASILLQPNDNPPTLINESISASTGYQNTSLTFRVTYEDADNNKPSFMRVVINGTDYEMEKQDPDDYDYTDGCNYQLSTFLQPAIANYCYYMECSDGEYRIKTIECCDIHIYYSNQNNPSLTEVNVHPMIGTVNITNFNYSIIYSDPDNNAPLEVNLTINSSSYTMTKYDILDNNYIDGCLYVYSTILDDTGTYIYSFSCFDGIYSAFTSTSNGPTVENLTFPFKGMFLNYSFEINEKFGLIKFQYNNQEGSYFNVDWMDYNSELNEWNIIGKWKEDFLTRLMIPISGRTFGYAYTPLWIHKDIALGDHIRIAVDNEGDHDFLVSDEIICEFPGIGLIDLWEVTDLTVSGGIAWYEKSTGLLLNGTYFYNGYYYYTFEFISTNVDIEELGDIEPIADFQSDQTIVENQYNQFTFTGRRGNGLLFFDWDFGDESPHSQEENPMHQYRSPGTYTVSLNLTDSDGDWDYEQKIDFILVEEDIDPISDFEVNATHIFVGEYVQFTFTGSEGNAPAHYYWNFGDGTVSFIKKDPVHQYNSPGNYIVSLRVTDSNGDRITSSKYELIIVDTYVPIVNFNSNTTTIFDGDIIQFSFIGFDGDGPSIFKWDFGDGSPFSNDPNPTHQYISPGNYTVSLNVTDTDGDWDYEEKINLIVVIEDILPIADFYVNTTIAVAGDYIQFIFNGSEGNTPSTYTWMFGDGYSIVTYKLNISHRYMNTGIYNVTLGVIDFNGDQNDKIKINYIKIEEHDHPIVDFNTNTTRIFEGEYIKFNFIGIEGNAPVIFTWDFGDGSSSSNERNPTHQYMFQGTFTVSLNVSDIDGDWDYEEKLNYIIVIKDLVPVADFNANATSLVVGQFVQFTFTGREGNGPTFLPLAWDFGDGMVYLTSVDYIVIHQYTSPGNYTVSLKITDSDGDWDYEEKINFIIVNENLRCIADFEVNTTTTIIGDYIQFTFTGSEGNGPTTFLWDFGDGSSSSNERNPTHQYMTQGNYSVSLNLTDSDGDKDYCIKINFIIIIAEPRVNGIPGYDLLILTFPYFIILIIIFLKKRSLD